MKRLIFAILISALVLSCSKNAPPVIETLIAEPDSVYPGDTVFLVFSAYDPDNDQIISSFNCEHGTLVPENPADGLPHRWVAPKEPGDYNIILEISDLNHTVTDGVMVHVMDPFGTFIDPRDGHQYEYVHIGQQIWMAENLAYLPAVHPPSMGGYQDPFYYVQGYEGTSVAEAIALEAYRQYGVLYNWKAVQTACPAGWHMASDADWMVLEKYLGMSEEESEETDVRTSGEVGKKIKSASGWFENGNGENSFGFNAPPGGSRNANNEFGTTGMRACYRTSTAGGSSFNFSRVLDYSHDGTSRGTVSHGIGFSARCVKNQ